MKLFLLILALSVVVGFSQTQSAAQVTCETCPLPDATPTPQPTPFDPPPFGCFYIIVDGVKREVCE